MIWSPDRMAFCRATGGRAYLRSPYDFDSLPPNGTNDFRDFYGTSDADIVKIDYYGKDTSVPEFSGVTEGTYIEDIAQRLAFYLMRLKDEGMIRNRVDIAAHSMGGLVVRHMIERYYVFLKDEGITIDHVATIATPNHGTGIAYLASLATILGHYPHRRCPGRPDDVRQRLPG